MQPPQPANSRFLALRHAGQDATDFALSDDAVHRFIALRDEGLDDASIGRRLGLEPDVVDELVRADEQQAIAHRIATGVEPMYPAPDPDQRVADTRSGSSAVPMLAIVLVLAGVIVYALLR